MINMSKVPTEKILSLIRDNSNLPFYVFVSCDDIDTYGYSSVLQEINDIDVDYVWSDDERLYVKSWNEEDLAEDFYNNMTDEWLEEHGFDTKIPMSNEDCDRLYQMCVDMVESLDWEKCIVAWSSNPY